MLMGLLVTRLTNDPSPEKKVRLFNPEQISNVVAIEIVWEISQSER